MLALAATLRDEAAVLDALVDRELGRPRARSSCGGCGSCRRALAARLVVQRLADARRRPARRPAPPGGSRDILALRDTGTDAPSICRGGSRAATAVDGVLSFSSTPGLAGRRHP